MTRSDVAARARSRGITCFAVCLTLAVQVRQSVSATTETTLRFADSYGSHMVLQQAPRRAVVWGYCDGECSPEELVLTLDDERVTVTTGSEPGTWVSKLPPVEASFQSHTIVLASAGGWPSNRTGLSSGSQVLRDVLFGDVWVCSGQSNMAFLLENAFNGTSYVNSASNYTALRMFTSFKTNASTPLQEVKVEEPWSVSSPEAVSMHRQRRGALDDDWLYMSAVCYLFGKNIHEHTGQPVGLVNTNWGGTPIEFWSSSDALSKCSRPAKSAGGGFNGMVKPLLNMTIFGAIWYQGENNIHDAISATDPSGLPMAHYGCSFPAMITDWREKWHSGSYGETDLHFPFGYGQLASWDTDSFGPSMIRWSQSAGYGRVPNPAMKNVFSAVAIDLTDRKSPYGSVHIRDKESVSRRLAAGGIGLAYSDEYAYWQGPVLRVAVSVDNRAITVAFDNVGGGLDIRNASGFEVCVTGSNNNCSLDKASGWSPGRINMPETDKLRDAVVVDVPEAIREEKPTGYTGKLLIRYAWRALAWEYKKGGIYAKGTDLVAGPFVALVVRGKSGISSPDHAAERQALVDLYHATNGASWRRSDRWISDASVCTWYGVVCSNTTGRILQFSLYDNLLEGTIPSSLSALDQVEYFALSTNKLHGPIPTRFGETFSRMRYFDLRYNHLNGTLPLSLGEMVDVNHLVLADNEFTDREHLAPILAKLRNLSYLDVRSNRLTGDLHAAGALCTLRNLTFCGLVNSKYPTNSFQDVPSCLVDRCMVNSPILAKVDD